MDIYIYIGREGSEKLSFGFVVMPHCVCARARACVCVFYFLFLISCYDYMHGLMDERTERIFF